MTFAFLQGREILQFPFLTHQFEALLGVYAVPYHLSVTFSFRFGRRFHIPSIFLKFFHLVKKSLPNDSPTDWQQYKLQQNVDNLTLKPRKDILMISLCVAQGTVPKSSNWQCNNNITSLKRIRRFIISSSLCAWDKRRTNKHSCLLQITEPT